MTCRAVDGPSSNDAWMDQSASTGAGTVTLMALASSTVNTGWVWTKYIASLPPRGGPNCMWTCTTVLVQGSTRGTATSMWRGAVSTTSCTSVGTQGRLGTALLEDTVLMECSSLQGTVIMTNGHFTVQYLKAVELDGGTRIVNTAT